MTPRFPTHHLAADVQVIERDWLNANQVLLGPAAAPWVVDTGYALHADTTVAAVDAALAGRPLGGIAITHGHSDHLGGVAALQARHRCAVWVPEGEWSAIARWDTRALWLDEAGQYAPRFRPDGRLRPGEPAPWGEGWQVHAATGHAFGGVMFHRPEDGLLVTGDALWANGLGLLAPDDTLTDALAEAGATLDRIAALPVRWVAPGHGAPFQDCAAALDRARLRLARWAADPASLALHTIKALAVYWLMARDPLPEAAWADALHAIPMIRDAHACWLSQQPWPAFAGALLQALIERGAVLRRDGMLRAAPVA